MLKQGRGAFQCFLAAIASVDIEQLFSPDTDSFPFEGNLTAFYRCFGVPEDISLRSVTTSTISRLAGDYWIVSSFFLVAGGLATCFLGLRLYERLRNVSAWPLSFVILGILLEQEELPVYLLTVKESKLPQETYPIENGWQHLHLYDSTFAAYSITRFAMWAAMAVGASLIATWNHFIEIGVVIFFSSVIGALLGGLVFLLLHVWTLRIHMLLCDLILDAECGARNIYGTYSSMGLIVLGSVIGLFVVIPRSLGFFKISIRLCSSISGSLMCLCGVAIFCFRSNLTATFMADLCTSASTSSNTGTLSGWSKQQLLAGMNTIFALAMPFLSIWGFLYQSKHAETKRLNGNNANLSTLYNSDDHDDYEDDYNISHNEVESSVGSLYTGENQDWSRSLDDSPYVRQRYYSSSRRRSSTPIRS